MRLKGVPAIILLLYASKATAIVVTSLKLLTCQLFGLATIHGRWNNRAIAPRTSLTVLANEGHWIATEVFSPCLAHDYQYNPDGNQYY